MDVGIVVSVVVEPLSWQEWDLDLRVLVGEHGTVEGWVD
jgi:hypothetical protein